MLEQSDALVSSSLMDFTWIVLMLPSMICIGVTAQLEKENLISLNSSLSPENGSFSWASPSGRFAFGFYPQGRGFSVGIWLVGTPTNTVVWTANRDDPPVTENAKIYFTGDGEFRLQAGDGTAISITGESSDPALGASMLDSGNFVLYDENLTAIWGSFNSPTDTILGGQHLTVGHKLISSESRSDLSSGRFFLGMQEDGNLVSYPVNSSATSDDAYWSSGTWNFASELSLNTEGDLYISTYSVVRILFNSSDPHKRNDTLYRAKLDPDGIFRLYSHRFEKNGSSIESILWSSLRDQCAVKGFCGFNSYCSGPGTRAECDCLPGFMFNKPNKTSDGCSRNFKGDYCRGMKSHNITALGNIGWGDYPYYKKSMEMGDCSKSCMDDCNCGAAMYSGGNCFKYKLPIRYARRDVNEKGIALLKLQQGDLQGVLDGGFAGNHAPPAPMSPQVKMDSKRSLILLLSLSLGSFAFLCLIIAISSFWVYRHQVWRYRQVMEEVINLGSTENLRSFSYQELEKVTDGFREELGRGSYGAVYKGVIVRQRENKIVAVKRLEKVVDQQGEKEFLAEMTAVGRTHHKNLVRLLGFCIEGSRKLLVYEFMRNGSLAHLLFNAGSGSSTSTRPIWKERVRIALELGRGILYLHEECEPQIIHCDIKPQNILMDEAWTTKISDFGFSKLLLPNEQGLVSGGRVRGTACYSAPELQNRNIPISAKVDVYSFGVVLLEIVCCRRSIEVEVSTPDEIILYSWVYGCLVAGELNKLVVGDHEEIDSKSLETMVKVGLWCVQQHPHLRPSMKNVILMLQGNLEIPVPPSPATSSSVITC